MYQDLAVVPLMSVWRNFFLGNEKRKGLRMDIPFMKKTCKEEMLAMGIDLRDVEQPIGTLSGGERQCVAISRAVYFGAKVLILDEPTAALGVKQSGVVLKYVIQARERGLGVIFITHNPHHAYPVGDRFLLLNRGRSIGYYEKSQVTRDELTGLMAGGSELEQLSHELESAGGAAAGVAAMLEEEAEELGTASHDPAPATSPHGQPAGMTQRIRIGLAGLGRMGRIHAASRSAGARGRARLVPHAGRGATSALHRQAGEPVTTQEPSRCSPWAASGSTSTRCRPAGRYGTSRPSASTSAAARPTSRSRRRATGGGPRSSAGPARTRSATTSTTPCGASASTTAS